ncbi:failed axon connections homolog [Penaeus chinensis]|uniref:failed axon connections homolog n=1 Tax=Penaeus chinensis TaxID=139456 RepID=UPI001FB625EF|nr:failed axon connections homolog [Penaeus chinensis]
MPRARGPARAPARLQYDGGGGWRRKRLLGYFLAELCWSVWSAMIQDLVKTWWSHALAALIVAVVFYLGRRKIMKLRRKKKQRKEWDSVGHNVVLLHQFQRGKFCPNLGPFALKVETFLRLAGIEYKVDTESPFGPKGKCPWITLNGEDLGDSEFILERLASEFDVDLDSHLDPQKAAALEAVRILADEHLFWCVITWRYWLDGCKSFLKSQSFAPFLRRAFPLFMKRGMKERARHHGIGKHSPEEIFHMCKKACRALSLVLGESPFFGGERPSTADCAIFGQLAQLKWNAPGSSYESIVTEAYPNLSEYCDRMRDRIYPDWNQLLKPE